MTNPIPPMTQQLMRHTLTGALADDPVRPERPERPRHRLRRRLRRSDQGSR